MKIKGQIDPTSVADMWMRSRPRGDGRVNQMEMWQLVGILSDNKTNIDMAIDKGGPAGEKTLYNKKTCGGLLACPGDQNPDLSLGGIAKDPAMSRFEFQSFRKGVAFFGELHFFPAPMRYANDDRAMLFGIVQHELRHYMDFLDNERRPIETGYLRDSAGGYELDLDAYSRNITEMRAHADQAAELLRIMGGAENAKKAIRESQFGLMMVSELSEAMMAFIDALDRQNGSVAAEAAEPTAVVVRSEDHEVRRLVGHLERMCEVMKFSNNVGPKK